MSGSLKGDPGTWRARRGELTVLDYKDVSFSFQDRKSRRRRRLRLLLLAVLVDGRLSSASAR